MEAFLEGVPYLYQDNLSKKLVVIFAGATRQYNLVRDLIDNPRYDYLWLYENDLLEDGYFRWYSNPTFKSILELVLANYASSNISFIGSSMGGYGAFKFAKDFDIKNILVRAPQIDLETSRKHFTMSRVPFFADLVKDYATYETRKLYYECPNHEPDKIQLSFIKPNLDRNGNLLIYSMRPEIGHVGGMWNGERIFNILDLFEKVAV